MSWRFKGIGYWAWWHGGAFSESSRKVVVCRFLDLCGGCWCGRILLRFLRGCLLGESYITILIDDGLYWLRQSLWALRLLLEAVSEEVVHFSPGCRRVQAAVCRLCLYCFLFLFCVVVGVSVWSFPNQESMCAIFGKVFLINRINYILLSEIEWAPIPSCWASLKNKKNEKSTKVSHNFTKCREHYLHL